MPKKYQIEIEPAESRFEPVFKLSSIERDRCLGCLDCAKRDCIYDVYQERRLLPGELVASTDHSCKMCLRCVQECRNQILVKLPNPEFEQLGNEYWKPEIITSLWQQAQTGKIPVSGAGYGGPFSGEGFDVMWTDMSEIVRPTRDGIHGREYISTSIDIGRRPANLRFINHRLPEPLPPSFSLPLPLILDLPERARAWTPVKKAVLAAAKRCGLLAFGNGQDPSGASIIPRYRPGEKIEPRRAPLMIEITVGAGNGAELERAEKRAEKLRERMTGTVICIGLPLDREASGRVRRLAKSGIGAVHLYADRNGREIGAGPSRFVKDVVREVHLALVDEALRDSVTLLAGGGIALAEHVAKLIACGADGVVVDEALLVALECRMCLRCLEENECQLELNRIDPSRGSRRIINLLGSWHSQLIEVLGAMGLREIRRLRGEVGRVMFFKDLEEECFAPIFGKRKSSPVGASN
jgi:ferredoxin